MDNRLDRWLRRYGGPLLDGVDGDWAHAEREKFSEIYCQGLDLQIRYLRDNALRMGEWNEMRIRVVGPRVTTWINGVEMIDLTDETIGAATGHLALQIHDGGGIKVRWRNLRVVEY